MLQIFEEKQLVVFVEEFTKHLAVIYEKKGSLSMLQTETQCGY